MPNRVISLGEGGTMGEQAIDMHRQMLRAGLRAGVRAKKAVAEGKITIAEYAAFMADMGLVVESLRVLNTTPQILSIIPESDYATLTAEAIPILTELGVKVGHEEVVRSAFAFIKAGTDFLNSIAIESL